MQGLVLLGLVPSIKDLCSLGWCPKIRGYFSLGWWYCNHIYCEVGLDEYTPITFLIDVFSSWFFLIHPMLCDVPISPVYLPCIFTLCLKS